MDARLLMTLSVKVEGAQRIGAVPHGTRVTALVSSGTFEGPRLRGAVLPGSGDWTLLRSDGVLETDDGALVHMTFEGIRDDSAAGAPYFRTTPRFETAAPKYAFLNRLLSVGKGEITPNGPVHVIEEIL